LGGIRSLLFMMEVSGQVFDWGLVT
jgi:hypothetical protein